VISKNAVPVKFRAEPSPFLLPQSIIASFSGSKKIDGGDEVLQFTFEGGMLSIIGVSWRSSHRMVMGELYQLDLSPLGEGVSSFRTKQNPLKEEDWRDATLKCLIDIDVGNDNLDPTTL
jgi:hypothetical protein